MFRALLAVLLLAAATAIVSGVAAAGAGQKTPGDIDGDGSASVTDAVYLLNWLFAGGPEPAPLNCTSELPGSGQSSCHDDAGVQIPCDDRNWPGQDAAYSSGCSGENRFANANMAVIADTCTGLEWQQASSASENLSWTDALRLADALILTADGNWVTTPQEAEDRGGAVADDWRIPSARELSSLIDFGRLGPAAPAALDMAPAGYWTSTSYAGGPDQAWCINFFDGKLEPISKAATLKLVLVRG